MRRLTTAILVMAMLGGCTYRQSKITAQAGGLTMLGGVATFGVGFAMCPSIDCGSSANDSSKTALDVASVLFLLGTAIAVSGLAGMVIHHDSSLAAIPSE